MSTDAVFAYRDSRPGRGSAVEVGFTDRRLDLGDHAAPELREAGLRAVAEATGAAPLLMHQVHGAEVQVVERWSSATWDPRVDALVTARRGVALLTRAADCVPVLLADAAVGVVGAAHAGRQGVVAGVVPAALTSLRELGASDVTAWVGPHVCGACYEVPAGLRAEVAALVPETFAETSWGTPALDLGAGVTAQLLAAGCAVVQVGRCTREDHDLHSHRRDGVAAGRFAGVIWMRAA